MCTYFLQTCVPAELTVVELSVRGRERKDSKSSFLGFNSVCMDVAISECITQNVSLLHCTSSSSLADNNH